MKNATGLALALGAVLIVSAPASAQDALAKRVSLDLKAMAPTDAFKVIGDAVGHAVDVAPDVSTPVDILVRNVTAKTALNTICESIGCSWKLVGTTITVKGAGGFAVAITAKAKRGQSSEAGRLRAEQLKARFDQKLPADMRFENVPLAQVVTRLAEVTGLDITLTGDTAPGQTFSADLSNRPFSAALTALSQQVKGNVVCRMTLPKDEATGSTPMIAIQIGGPNRKVKK